MTENHLPPIPVPASALPKARPRLVQFLIVAALVTGWLFWPPAWLWLHNSAPEVLTLEEFITHGSSREWLTLKDCYVDASGRVDTVATKRGQIVGGSYSYYPLRTAPSDTRPNKVFVRPSSWSEGAGQAWLGQPNEAPVDISMHAINAKDTDRQQVSGMLASGWNYRREKDILRSHGAPDAALLLHNDHPPGAVAGLAAMGVPPLLAVLALVFHKRGKRVEGSR